MDGFHGYRRARLHSLLDDTNLAEGAIVSGSGLHVERVRRTLFDGNDLPHVIALESDTLGSDEVTALDVHFDDMALNSGQILCITRPLEITSNTIGKGEAVTGVNGVTLFSSCSNRIPHDVCGTDAARSQPALFDSGRPGTLVCRRYLMRTVFSLIAAHVLTSVGFAQTFGTGDKPRCFFWETAPTRRDRDERHSTERVPLVPPQLGNGKNPIPQSSFFEVLELHTTCIVQSRAGCVLRTALRKRFSG